MVSSAPRATSKGGDAVARSVTHGARFFFQVPNIVLDLGLSSLALALYCVIRRTAGEEGMCWRSTPCLAEMAGMSVGSVCNAKRDLCQPFALLDGKPLIEITKQRNPGGGKPRDIIRVTHIWSENERRYSSNNSFLNEKARSARELGNSRAELASSADEIKKNSVRKLNEEHTPSLSPSRREIERECVDFSELWNSVRRIFKRTDNRKPTKREQKLMQELLPVAAHEYELVEWWMGLDTHHRDLRQGIGFLLHRRPRSVTSLLRRWNEVNDAARHYREQLDTRGHML